MPNVRTFSGPRLTRPPCFSRLFCTVGITSSLKELGRGSDVEVFELFGTGIKI